MIGRRWRGVFLSILELCCGFQDEGAAAPCASITNTRQKRPHEFFFVGDFYITCVVCDNQSKVSFWLWHFDGADCECHICCDESQSLACADDPVLAIVIEVGRERDLVLRAGFRPLHEVG